MHHNIPIQPPSMDIPTPPTSVVPPNRQEMISMHSHMTSHPHLALSGDFYQVHPLANMGNYYSHSSYNQHVAYPPYYGMQHMPIPSSMPHVPIPSPIPYMPNPGPATYAPIQHHAPRYDVGERF